MSETVASNFFEMSAASLPPLGLSKLSKNSRSLSRTPLQSKPPVSRIKGQDQSKLQVSKTPVKATTKSTQSMTKSQSVKFPDPVSPQEQKQSVQVNQ